MFMDVDLNSNFSPFLGTLKGDSYIREEGHLNYEKEALTPGGYLPHNGKGYLHQGVTYHTRGKDTYTRGVEYLHHRKETHHYRERQVTLTILNEGSKTHTCFLYRVLYMRCTY